MVPLLPAHVAKGSVVRDVLGDVGDLVDPMVVLEDLEREEDRQHGYSNDEEDEFIFISNSQICF